MPTPIPFIDLEPIILKAGPGQSSDGYLKATAFLIDWHGGCNEYGAFVDAEVVTLAQIGKCSAEALLALTPKGIWLTGAKYNAQVSAGIKGPNVWCRKGYHTREDAIRAAAELSHRFFAGAAKSLNSCMTDTTRRACARMADLLIAIAHPTQTALFDTALSAPLPSSAPQSLLPSPPAIKAAPIQLSLF